VVVADLTLATHAPKTTKLLLSDVAPTIKHLGKITKVIKWLLMVGTLKPKEMAMYPVAEDRAEWLVQAKKEQKELKQTV
jgi:hypothetical protein